ncbi:hypothetical protein [Neoaquamicrobium sediminum]|uniref:hypothetical protein n=1 Tax=Neoaquamicrobium sediminum TaxID=1849104 RepID=UPI00156787E9|nr:hypothetical protein [Mesorhizobium sediminum]
MADNERDPRRVQLKDVRIGHPQLFNARGFGKSNSGEKAYSAQFYIDLSTKQGKAQEDAILDAEEAAMEREFGEDRKKWRRSRRTTSHISTATMSTRTSASPSGKECSS